MKPGGRSSDAPLAATRPSAALPTPLYHQLHLILREAILTGEHQFGDRLPAEGQLARMFQVSAITVRRALAELAAEGLVKRNRGKGTFVVRRSKVKVPPIQGNIGDLIESFRRIGNTTEARLIALDDVVPNPEVARAIGVEPGQPVRRAIRVRSHHGRPYCYGALYLPPWVTAEIDRSQSDKEGWSEGQILSAVERLGARITRARQTIGCAVADAIVGPILQVKIGSPLLSVKRLLIDQFDRPLKYIHVLYDPQQYELHVELSYPEGAGDGALPAVRGGRISEE